MSIVTINAADAKEEFSELLNRVSHHKERIVITRREKEIAAIVSMEDFTLLQAIQDRVDLNDAIASLKEVREKGTVSLDALEDEIG